MSIAHGVRRAAVIGAGQMGTSRLCLHSNSLLTLMSTGLGIAFVSAVHAKVPVLLYDKSPAQIKSGLGLMDKILAKDVSKGKLTSEAAKEARERVTAVDDLKHFRDAYMVIEVSCRTFTPAQVWGPRSTQHVSRAASLLLPCVIPTCFSGDIACMRCVLPFVCTRCCVRSNGMAQGDRGNQSVHVRLSGRFPD